MIKDAPGKPKFVKQSVAVTDALSGDQTLTLTKAAVLCLDTLPGGIPD